MTTAEEIIENLLNYPDINVMDSGADSDDCGDYTDERIEDLWPSLVCLRKFEKSKDMKIYENYCSFEMSERLKRLGFNYGCYAAYFTDKKEIGGVHPRPIDYNGEKECEEYGLLSAPEIHLVAAWLRKEKKLIPWVELHPSEDNGVLFQASVCDLRTGEPLWSQNVPAEMLGGTGLDTTWEDAMEEAIERCLDLLEEEL